MNAVSTEVEADPAVDTESLERVPGPRNAAHIEEEEEEDVLIATEYFDAGFVGDLDVEENEEPTGDSDTHPADLEDPTDPEDPALAGDPVDVGSPAAETDGRTDAVVADAAEDSRANSSDGTVVTTDATDANAAPLGARSAARMARREQAEQAKAIRLEPGNRRHGVLGLALLLVLGHQIVPAAVPGGHVGVNVVLAGLAFGLWSLRRAPNGPRRGGRRRAESEEASGGRRGAVLGALGLALIAFAAFAPDPTNVAGRFAPLAMLGTVLLLLGVNTEPPGRLAQTMAFAPLRRLGQMCLQLLAALVALLGVVPATIGWEPNAAVRVALTALAVGIGYLSMRQMERTRAAAIQRARHRNPYVVGATASAAAVALALTGPGTGSGSTQTEFVAAVESTELPEPVPASPTASLPFGDRCWAVAPSFASTSCTFGDKTSKVSVALTGDQTAGAWLPALQALGLTKGWKITTHLAADCALTRSTDAACQSWSLETAKRIVKGSYDLVVVADDSATAAGGSFGEALRKAGQTVIGMPELVGPAK